MIREVKRPLDPNLYKPDGSRRTADFKGVLIDWEARDAEKTQRQAEEKKDEQERKKTVLETQKAVFEERIEQLSDQIREAKRLISVNEIHRQEIRSRRGDAFVQEIKIKQAEATIIKATEDIAEVRSKVRDLRRRLDFLLETEEKQAVA